MMKTNLKTLKKALVACGLQPKGMGKMRRSAVDFHISKLPVDAVAKLAAELTGRATPHKEINTKGQMRQVRRSLRAQHGCGMAVDLGHHHLTCIQFGKVKTVWDSKHHTGHITTAA